MMAAPHRRPRPQETAIAGLRIGIAISWVLVVGGGCSEDGAGPGVLQSSRSYRGHATDADISVFVRAYQHTVGTRLDDCQTCHRGGSVLQQNQQEYRANPCDFCHYVIHPPEGWSGLPASYAETLNPYGTSYRAAGRNEAALRTIASLDSDGDGHTNGDEIADLRYPGDAASHPGLALCPQIRMTLAEIQSLPSHSQFGLANANKQQFDYYATYTGVKIEDLLAAKGVDLSGAPSIDILSPDGFKKSFTVAQISEPFPRHGFYSELGVEDLGPDCGFVDYPAETHGYAPGDTILDEQWHILAYARDGQPLEESYLDPASGRIVGEGPFRNIVPPGAANGALNAPDRGKDWDASGCTLPEWNYDANKDHNAGSMVKAAVIIRIDPMPEGCEEFDIINGGWAMVDESVLLVYGHGVMASR